MVHQLLAWEADSMDQDRMVEDLMAHQDLECKMEEVSMVKEAQGDMDRQGQDK